jgi:hypothetical protein
MLLALLILVFSDFCAHDGYEVALYPCKKEQYIKEEQFMTTIPGSEVEKLAQKNSTVAPMPYCPCVLRHLALCRPPV